MSRYVQRGENPAFPKEVDVWETSKLKELPSWILDRCKIIGFDDNNLPVLKTIQLPNGSIEIIGADDNKFLTVKNITDLAIRDCQTGIISIISLIKFNLLYKKQC